MPNKAYDQPQSPRSVGHTSPQVAEVASAAQPLQLEAGGSLREAQLEYETYGTLNKTRDNAILITHALTGDAHVAGWDDQATQERYPWRGRKPGWWDAMVGPGKAIDTDIFFVVCANVLGGCYGSTGPASLNPATQAPYGLAFPVVTIGDYVRSQARLADALGIDVWHTVIGGSLGGQQALEWSLAYPERVRNCVVLAAASRLSTQGLAFNAVGRYSIMHDPEWREGDFYQAAAVGPENGLAAARMLAHITYISDDGMVDKFGRRLQGEAGPQFGFGVEFEVESYLDYQGRSFVQRFDANSYLYVTRAMDYYDAAAQWGGGELSVACARSQARTMVVSFSSDWLYPPSECRLLAQALCHRQQPVTYLDIPSRYGHDAFLVEIESVGRVISAFLRNG
jgi:homoserine O-acetyltransferase